ncbi:MAG TPA: AMP-binding protein [Acidimicrobiales bacterium]
MFPGAHAESTPDKPAVILGSSGRVVTYADLDAEANQVSHLFRSLGLQPGDHVAFCLENHPRFFALAWGAIYAGLYYTAMSSRLTTDEMAYILEDSGARVFVTSAYKRDQAAELTGRLGEGVATYMMDGTVDGYESWEQALAAQPTTPLPEERVEGLDMLYSSGTTGRPKGVEAPLPGSPLGTPDPIHFLVTALFGATADSVYLSPAPLYHAAPLRFCLGFQRVGATVVVMERFDPEGALALIEKHRVTHSQWVPTMFIRMLKLPAEVRERYDVSSLQVAIHAAAPCPVAAKEQMIDWWGPVLHEYYAGTEGNGFVYCDSAAWLEHRGTVGQALVGKLHIVGEDGDELPPREVGTVYFESDAQFSYHNDPEKTAASRDPKGRGWTTLGDVGYLDEDGYLFLTDRRADLIISGGVNIYPREVEDVLITHPAVADIAVFGVPDPDMGEQVKAVVQAADGAEPGDRLAAELMAFAREHLAGYKCPRSIDFEDELPRLPTGKLYKRLLRDRYWAAAESKLV